MFDDRASRNGDRRPGPPAASSQRWQPLRAGLLNLYRFDEEEFHFERGRLLLRGNNGTGKSRVLAMQLPFLLDADVAPHRVEPDRNPAKRLEWNLLMDRYPDRLGYTWLEFGRRDEEGGEHYLTIGIGLHAVQGRGAPNHWHFITRRRIGLDLHLRNEQDQPLSRDRLAEALGDAGQLFTTARDYRRAVDEALFKLGEARYAALVELLIQLRQPQLTRELDERRLSAALSEALPPVEPRIIGDVADSFRGLESDRLALQRSEAAGGATEAFLREYAPYARCAARRRAAGVRVTHGAYEQAQRDLRAAETKHREAAAAVEEAGRELARLAGELDAAEATIKTLAASPEMRAAHELDAAHRDAKERAGDLSERTAEHETAAERSRRASEELAETTAANERAIRDANNRAAAAATAAGDAGLLTQHEASTAGLDAREAQPAVIERAERDVQRLIEQRRAAIRHLRDLVRAADAAGVQLSIAKQSQTDLQAQLDRALDAERSAAEAATRAGKTLLGAYRAWAQRVVELSPAPASDLVETLDDWCDTGAGSSPTTAAIHQALATAVRERQGERAATTSELAEVRRQIATWEEQRSALEAGRHEPPPMPSTRDADARAHRETGAPLWSLLDFADGVTEPDRAGIEAAMEAAGLLDAWVTPDGRVFDATTSDTCVLPGSPLPASVATLADVLLTDAAAATAAKIADGVVSGVLARIGLGEGDATTWIDRNGAWCNGPLRGRWAKPEAQHIGHAARERRRLRQIADLDAQIESARHIEQRLVAAVDRIDQRVANAQREAEQAPGDDGVRQALAERAAAARQVGELRTRVTDAERAVQERRQVFEAAQRQRDGDAADLGIAEWVDRLDVLQEAVGEYRQAAAMLWAALRRAVDAQRSASRAAARADEAAEHTRAAAQRRDEAARKLRAAEARLDTLQASVGQSARDIRARLGQAELHAQHLKMQEKAVGERETTQKVALGLAEQEARGHAQALERHQHERGTAIEALSGFVRTGLLPVAAAELSGEAGELSSVTRAVELARRIESILADTRSDDEMWAKREREMHKHIQALTDSLLPHDLRPQTTMIDQMLVVSVLYNGRECGIDELREALADDTRARRTLLEENERRVLEQTLIDEVATHVHDRLHEAERLVQAMNEQIGSRPMSTGMRLKFTWEAIDDGPPGLSDARRRLLGAGVTWSPEERAALGRFLHQQIQAVRAANEAATWQQQIEEAFDYRQWHRFGVMRQQEGKWQRLTKRTHGTGSGGEKAVALTLPMFAAASAHYQSADRLAPRPILLDEVFAGIDRDMRGKCMGLLEAFDLDFIMTSESEWGCYAEIPGVAIYQLTTMQGNDGVLATRWLWNGRRRERVDPSRPLADQETPANDGNGTLT